jgi:hypothetical protein
MPALAKLSELHLTPDLRAAERVGPGSCEVFHLFFFAKLYIRILFFLSKDNSLAIMDDFINS